MQAPSASQFHHADKGAITSWNRQFPNSILQILGDLTRQLA